MTYPFKRTFNDASLSAGIVWPLPGGWYGTGRATQQFTYRPKTHTHEDVVLYNAKWHNHLNVHSMMQVYRPVCLAIAWRLVRSIMQILVHQIYARHMYIFIAFVQKTQRTTLAYLLFVASNYAHTTLQHIIVFNAMAHATYTDLMWEHRYTTHTYPIANMACQWIIEHIVKHTSSNQGYRPVHIGHCLPCARPNPARACQSKLRWTHVCLLRFKPLQTHSTCILIAYST